MPVGLTDLIWDAETTMWVAAGEAGIELGERTTLDLTGAFLTWQDADAIEPALWRQNSWERGVGFVYDYDVVDLVARLHRDAGVEAELVVDVCRNLADDEGHTGVWLALVLDGAARRWPRLEYVYVWVDRDATLAAYPADDYLWTTGWEGHELKLAHRLGDHAMLRATGLLSRYKDAPQRRSATTGWVGRASSSRSATEARSDGGRASRVLASRDPSGSRRARSRRRCASGLSMRRWSLRWRQLRGSGRWRRPSRKAPGRPR